MRQIIVSMLFCQIQGSQAYFTMDIFYIEQFPLRRRISESREPHQTLLL